MNNRPARNMYHGKKAKKGTFKRVLRYFFEDKFLIIMMVLITLLTAFADLLIPIFEGELVNIINIKVGEKINFDSLYKTLIFMGANALFVVVFSYFNAKISAKVAINLSVRLRKDLFNKTVKLPISFVDKHPHGDLMSRMSNDVETIFTTVANSLISIVEGIFIVTITFCLMMYFSVTLTVVSLTALVLTILVFQIIHKYGRKYFKRQQTILGDLNALSEEDIVGNKTIIAYNKQDEEVSRFNNISDDLAKNSIRATGISMSMPPIMNFITNLTYLLIVLVGGYLSIEYAMDLGIIVIFINYSKKFTRPINQIGQLFGQIQTSLVSCERVFEVIDHKEEIDEGYSSFENHDGSISIEHINFGYKKDELVLKDFSLNINKGEKIALVGATGSGKTTIVNLLMRFYEPNDGIIKVFGKDIREVSKKELRDRIAIVLQDTVLFNDTIKNNVKYADHTKSDEEVIDACKTSYADYFINHTENGYETILKEQGNNISSGQKQLLAIARVILKDPEILILDDATSNVDTRTEKNIQDAMIELMKDRTSIIIAHRLSTIIDADKIVVIDKGQIIEVGNHYQLLNKKGKYYSLYTSQFEGNQI